MSDKAAARAKFEGVFAKIRDELTAHMKSEGLPDEAVEWYAKNLDYNVPGGKLNRGMSVVDSVKILRGRELTDDEYFKSALLGWCVELLQAFFLVSDDMMDQSVTRRGQPCWYRVPSIGNIAINDSFMLEAAIYHLLKTHFRKEKYYVHLLELFHETTYQTEFGQLIDLITAPEDHVDLNKFSLKKHHLIVVYKTAYYSFYLPVALALYMCHLTPADTTPLPPTDPFQISLDILIPLGEYFQIQDDYLDYSGTAEQIGKVGTDIVDNKCSWCINTALAIVNPEQRKFLDESYGRKDAAKEQAVKDLYNKIGIPKIYEEYEEKVVGDLKAKIAAIPEPPSKVTQVDEPAALKREIFTAFLDKIYKRQK